MQFGIVPALASAFQPRKSVRNQIEEARIGRAAVAFTQVLAGGGGVGKAQLAAACAHAAPAEGTELVMWIDATETAQVITAYIRAAWRLRVPDSSGQDVETDARAFREWLAVTTRVLADHFGDLADPAGMRD
ncbi:hypothetical protein ABZ027_31630 [Streptomyces sp. NPDC006332]|uniref:hypothetical protein n=1 Tax=Streptomyces sp. NPDC006332 TaxID=3155456 RepID=UPI0033B80CBD